MIAAAALYFYTRGRPTPSEAARNRAFAESMNGVTLAGNSTGSFRSIFFLLATVVAAFGVASWFVRMPARETAA